MQKEKELEIQAPAEKRVASYNLFFELKKKNGGGKDSKALCPAWGIKGEALEAGKGAGNTNIK